MKLDKETLVKHQFWIVFGVFILFLLVTVFWLQDAAATGTEKDKETLKKCFNELDQNKNPISKQDNKALEDRENQLKRRKDEIWQKAWDIQQSLCTWPTEDLQKQLMDARFRLPIEDATLRGNYARKDIYDPQIEALEKIFTTKVTVGKEEKTFESVQFRGGAKGMLTYVSDWSKTKRVPTSDEMWFAQEDIWVQREVLQALLRANDIVAKFREVKGPPPGKDELYRQQFENADWQLDLAIVQNKAKQYVLRGRIKNISNAPLPIGKLYFLAQLHKGDVQPVAFPVEGETLPAGKDSPIADFILNVNNIPDGLLGVTQLYEGRLSPIRRLDALALGQQAHRTYAANLLLNKQSSQAKPEAEVKAETPPPKMKAGKLGGKVEADPDKLKVAAPGRYVVYNDQIRRLPVGLLLLVDQGHIPEILAALTNCRLRFQIVQFGWQRYRGDVVEGAKGAPVAEEQYGNLVELAVYCLVTLYDRYQPTAEAPPKVAGVPAPK
jgi:hypothetical protein